MARPVVNEDPIFIEETTGPRRWFNNRPSGATSPDYLEVMFDFLKYDATLDFVTVKDAGATVALGTDTLNGEILLTSTATTDNDGGSIQTLHENYALTAGKKTWFEAKIKVSDADQCDMFCGFAENFATDPEACLLASNRAGFQINDGDASILLKAEASDVEQSADSGQDASDSTYVLLGMYFDGSTLEYYVNRVKVGSFSAALPTANMALAFFHLTGDNVGTKVATCDYLHVVMQR